MRTLIRSPRKHFRITGGIKVEEHDMSTSSNRPTRGTAETEVLGLTNDAPAQIPDIYEHDGADDIEDEATAQSQPSGSKPRKSTLAMAIVRPRPQAQPDVAAEDAAQAADVGFEDDGIDGIADEVDEWSVADQPTIQMPPRVARASANFLESGEHKSWPPLRASSVSVPAPNRARPPIAPSIPRRQPISRPPESQAARLAAPDGRRVPPPPPGITRAAVSDPRMKRFQELQKRRMNPSSPIEEQPVTEAVRQWSTDLAHGLQRALRNQHEARASGTFPIPAYEPTPSSRLGDAFGQLAASARGLTEKAQAVAGPAIKRLHDQAEQAAQAIIERFEGSALRQQEPFLGPGRIAIFFRTGVTVGQAQRLLSASQARPMRIIPRKHGFLAYVKPGFEVEISERLRLHPYVRDVLYVEYDEYGDNVEQEDELAEEEMP